MAIAEVDPEVPAETASAPWTETTRLLCAAAYTEATFAQEVVEELLEEDQRAVEAPPAVDPTPVLRHCVAACARKRLRDQLLVANLIFFAVYVMVTLNALALGSWALTGGLAYLMARGAGRGSKLGRLLRRLLAVYFLLTLIGVVVAAFFSSQALIIALILLLSWAIVAYDFWHATYRIVTKQLTPSAFDPATAPPVASPELERRIEEIAERQAGNLTVYSGFLPFAGAGLDLGGWSFVVDLRKGREEAGRHLEPRPVEPLELYEGVGDALRDLHVSNLTIEDRVFVNGTDVRGDTTLLPSPTARPTRGVPDGELRRLMLAPTRRIRHYMCVRITDWRGELVLSLYVRFAIANGRLFCERSGFLLAPLKPELHRSDGISPEPELEDLAGLAWRSLVLTPLLWLRSPYALLRPLTREQHRARQLKDIERNAFFDYGAPETALDRARSSDYSRYFQKLDKEMYSKVLERTILDTIVDILDAHDIDTGELVERRSTIINYGLMVQSGSVEARNVAVGPDARIDVAGGGDGASTGGEA